MPMDPKKFTTILKTINIVVGLANLVLGGLAIFFTLSALKDGKIFLIAAPIWLTLFGLLSILAEFNIKWIRQNFKFMNSLVGKGFYYIFLGSVFYSLLEYASNSVVAWISCSVMSAMGIVYLCMECCLKKQYKEEYLREPLV